MTVDGDTLTLSTGRTVDLSLGIIGLAPSSTEHDHMTCCGFYDGYDSFQYASDWTPAERQELAAYMSALWLRWGSVIP